MTLTRDALPATAPIYLPCAVRRAFADLNQRFLQDRFRRLETTMGRSPSRNADDRTVEWMARCPFTLFELCMVDRPSIGTPANCAALDCTQPYFEDQMLAQATLVLASQLAESSRLTLAMALGSSPIPHAVVRNTPISRLPEWFHSKHVLRVRWLDHPHFWSTLFAAGRYRDDEMLSCAHCLGLTLLAGELMRPDAKGDRFVLRHCEVTTPASRYRGLE